VTYGALALWVGGCEASHEEGFGGHDRGVQLCENQFLVGVFLAHILQGGVDEQCFGGIWGLSTGPTSRSQ